MGYGTVLHVNAVGLLADLAEAFEPSLRGRPFVVANESAPRAAVLDVSAIAHREGLERGMPLAAALKTLPGLEVRAPRPGARAAAEEALLGAALRYSPVVERAGPGHLFVDLAGTGRLCGPPEDAACRLRAEIVAGTGLRPALALSSGKTASKVATRVFRPGGFVALSAAEESRLVRRQPASLLPGVGPALLERLRLLGLDDIGAVADLPERDARALGPRGPALVARARCEGDGPVDPSPWERRSVRAEAVLEPDTVDPGALRSALTSLAFELAFSLRRAGLGFASAIVGASYSDGYSELGRAATARLRERDDEALSLALEALARARTRRVRVRGLSLELASVAPAGPTLELFEPEELRRSRLQSALDAIRTRYGPGAIAPCAVGGSRKAAAPC